MSRPILRPRRSAATGYHRPRATIFPSSCGPTGRRLLSPTGPGHHLQPRRLPRSLRVAPIRQGLATLQGHSVMPKTGVRTALCILAAATIHTPAAFAQQQPAPPLVQQLNNGTWLPQKEAEDLRDELYYQRAVHAYITMLPALNVIGMRDGSEAAFGKGYNILPIWKDRMDARTWVPTPNADVIYSMNYLDLKETGPLVVAAPRDVIGMFTDFCQRTITDVGAIGPDRARGGLYLLLPPDYDGEIPQGYFAFKPTP